jgi:hypothetical protein
MPASSRMCGRLKGWIAAKTARRLSPTAKAGGRETVGCIILGRGEDDQKVREWLTTAASVPGFIGFAVGRTDFWDPLVDWLTRALRILSGQRPVARYRGLPPLLDVNNSGGRRGLQPLPSTTARIRLMPMRLLRAKTRILIVP